MSAGVSRIGRATPRRVRLPVVISLTAGLVLLTPLSKAALATSQGLPPSVSAGGHYSCAIESGKAYCWGANTYGQLGDDSDYQPPTCR